MDVASAMIMAPNPDNVTTTKMFKKTKKNKNPLLQPSTLPTPTKTTAAAGTSAKGKNLSGTKTRNHHDKKTSKYKQEHSLLSAAVDTDPFCFASVSKRRS